MEIFAKRLKELRLEKGETLRSMGELLGINNAAYYHYETGKHQPTMETILKIAEHFGVSTDYLFGKSDV